MRTDGRARSPGTAQANPRGAHAGAVHRSTAYLMLLEERHAETRRRDFRGCVKAAGAAPDDDRIVHARDYTGFFRATNQTCVARRGPIHGRGDATIRSIAK